ncbi:MAG: 5-bromo-4-chloroindolyl phosphate hydrolysis family protein [Bacilli bacterium]
MRFLYIPVGVFFGLAGVTFGLGGGFLFIGLGTGFLMAMFNPGNFLPDKKESSREEKRARKRERKIFVDAVQPTSLPTEQGETHSYFDQTLEQFHDKLKKLDALISKTPAEQRQRVADIVFLLRKVYEYVQRDPKKYTAVKPFFQTYISSTLTIVEKYVHLLDQPVHTESLSTAIAQTEALLGEMKTHYENDYGKLYEAEIQQMEIERKLLLEKFSEQKEIKWF